MSFAEGQSLRQKINANCTALLLLTGVMQYSALTLFTIDKKIFFFLTHARSQPQKIMFVQELLLIISGAGYDIHDPNLYLLESGRM